MKEGIILEGHPSHDYLLKLKSFRLNLYFSVVMSITISLILIFIDYFNFLIFTHASFCYLKINLIIEQIRRNLTYSHSPPILFKDLYYIVYLGGI